MFRSRLPDIGIYNANHSPITIAATPCRFTAPIAPSPNHDERRFGAARHADPALHRHAERRRRRSTGCAIRRRKVSAHYVVEEDGAIWRLVPEERRAWHAGDSSGRAAATSTPPPSASRSSIPATNSAIARFPRRRSRRSRTLCAYPCAPADSGAPRARPFRCGAGAQAGSGRAVSTGRAWRGPASACGPISPRNGPPGLRESSRRSPPIGYDLPAMRRLMSARVAVLRVPAPFPPRKMDGHGR